MFLLPLVACGGAEARPVARVEPTPEVEAQPEPEPEPAPEAQLEPLITPAPATCLEVPQDYILGCDGVSAPVRAHEELAAALTARAEAARSRRARRSPPSEPDDLMAPRMFDEEERPFVDALRADRCALPVGDAERAASTYRLARLYYEANQLSPAAWLFDEVALDPSAGELAVFAANLSLDSLNIRLTRSSGAAHEDCFVQLRSAVDRYDAHLCGGPIDDEELCHVLEVLSSQLTERGH